MRILAYFKPVALAFLALLLSCNVTSNARRDGNTNPPRVSSSDAQLQLTSDDSSHVAAVSILRVIANPKEFHGKRVQLMGFVHFEFEGDAIYLSKNDYQYGLDQNGIWLSIPKESMQKYREISDSYAVVDGTFNAESRGHMGSFAGSIENITLIKRWAKIKNSKDSQ